MSLADQMTNHQGLTVCESHPSFQHESDRHLTTEHDITEMTWGEQGASDYGTSSWVTTAGYYSCYSVAWTFWGC